MWDFIPGKGHRQQRVAASSERSQPGAPELHLPSRRTTAVLAALVLLASIGVGAALPGAKAGSARAGTPLTAALLARIAADSASAGSQSSAPPTQAATGSPEPEAPATAETGTSAEEGTAQGASTGQRAQGSETAGRSPETEAGSSTADEGGAAEGSSGSSNAGTGAGTGAGTRTSAAPVPASLLSQITHVWVISLAGGSFSAALANQSALPYLAKKLVPKGTLLAGYSLVGQSGAANDIALLSGQAPNSETEEGCPTYSPLAPATLDSKALASGSGCVYPSSVHTLADQTAEAALTWRAYIQDMAPAAASPETATAPSTCRHPAAGGTESTPSLAPGNDYLFARNPFVFFGSLIESQACAKDDVDLSQLSADLGDSAQTPNLSWIVPAACDDGARANCGSGVTTGLPGADAFLEKVVPEITATSDYKQHGLILIAFDSAAPGSGKNARQVGALVLSPFVEAGKRDEESFNTYSLLKSLERLFGVPLLGHAADQGVTELNAKVYRKATNTTLARTALARTEAQARGRSTGG